MTPFQHALIVNNVRLVHKLAQRYRHRPGVEYDDLVGAGMVGLLNAAKLFDPARGLNFAGGAGARPRSLRTLIAPKKGDQRVNLGPPPPGYLELLIAAMRRGWRRRRHKLPLPATGSAADSDLSVLDHPVIGGRLT